jgi:HSP20 family protein
MRLARFLSQAPRSPVTKMSFSITPRRNMYWNPYASFYPHHAHALMSPRLPQNLFRSLEEDFSHFDNFFNDLDKSLGEVRSFQPRFDVKEENDKFILHGELPGVEPQNLSVEFVDRNTMTVRGKIIREQTRGEQPAAIEQSQQQPQQQIEGQDQTATKATESAPADGNAGEHSYHKATVEDVDENAQKASTGDETQVAKATPQSDQQVSQAQKSELEPHYWVSERSVGEFHRSFRFPGRVDQDGVKANLKDGVLTVTVPKVKEHGRRVINIE